MTTAPEDQAPPALLDHCRKTYAAMMADANQVGESGAIVYEGFLTRLITSQLSLSVPYYTSIRKQLIRMGCIRQLKRGGGTSPSQWELIYEPTEEAFFRAIDNTDSKKRYQSKYEALATEARLMSQRISDLETTVDAIVEAFAEKFGSEEAAVDEDDSEGREPTSEDSD